MKLVRSDSPEVARDIAPNGALACWGSALVPVSVASLWSLLIALAVSVIVSVRVAVWIGVPVFLASSLFLLWRGRSTRLNWVIAVCAERVYVRLFARRGRSQDDVDDREIMVLEASEIASMSAKTIEVFLYGPKPKLVEWLVIEPAQKIAEDISDRIRPLQCGTSPNLCGIRPIDPSKQVFIGNEEGPLTIEWKYCRPALRSFLQQVAHQSPSIVIAPEQCFELDLNGIWHGLMSEPNAEQRRLLAQAIRLGFGSKCVQLLSLYRSMPFRQAREYLAEVERGESGAGY